MAYNIKTTKIGKAPIDTTHCNSSPMKLTLNTTPLQYKSPLEQHRTADATSAFGGGGGTEDKTQSQLILDRQKKKLKKSRKQIGKTMVDKGSW